MQYYSGKYLAEQLEMILRESKSITILHSGNPLHFRMSDWDYYIYLKCISYAGNPYPKNTTRAQLPKQDIFDTIKNSNACFMFWGYDIENDVYVCWDPQKAKSRLNDKTYVSFFSRKNIQESVIEGDIQLAKLTNGDKYVLFKSRDAVLFLEHITSYFSVPIKPMKNVNLKDISIFQNTEEGRLLNVRYDASVKLLIDEMLLSNEQPTVLSIISRCMAEYGEAYSKMGLKDWFAIVNKYQKEFNSEKQGGEEEDTLDSNDYEQTIINNYIERVSEHNIIESEDIKKKQVFSQRIKKIRQDVERFLDAHPSVSLRFYLNDLANYRVYSNDKIIELFRRHRNGDRLAHDLIVKSHLIFVVGYAYLFRKDGARIEDLIQEGNIGLLKAIEHFDHTRFRSFVNYAKNWIFQTVSFAASYMPYMTRLPLNQYSLYYKIQILKEKFEQQNGYQPSVADLEIDNNDYYENFNNIKLLYSLPDSLIEITSSVDDLDVFESNFNQIQIKEDAEHNSSYVNRLLKCLSGREEIIVRLYFGIGIESETLNSIGNKFNLTRERVRQLLSKAIRKMRDIIWGVEKYVENKETSESDNEVVTLSLAYWGDYIVLPDNKQLGRVIYTHLMNGEKVFYVLGVQDKKVYIMNKEGTLVDDKKKRALGNQSERMTPERRTFINSFYLNNNKKDNASDNQFKSENQAPKKTEHRVVKQPVIVSKSVPEMAKIGDRLLYDKRRCTVVEKRSTGGSPRLIVQYDDGTYDNVPNDIQRYSII